MNLSNNIHFAPRPTLIELFLVFLKLGSIGFGGPASHIAMMEQEFVIKRHWFTKEEFLDILGATHLIPGPNSTEMAIHIGHKMRNRKGLIVAGISFILPAMLMVWAIAWFYINFNKVLAIQAVFKGVTPVILAIIIQSSWDLSRNAIKDKILAILFAVSLVFSLMRSNEIIILISIAFLNLILRSPIWQNKRPFGLFLCSFTLTLFHQATGLGQIKNQVPATLEDLFGFFVRIGSVLFGSGYVLVAFLQKGLVEQRHWITQQQLMDAVAVGQFTPGPVFTTATFIGYLILGNLGAMVSTVGIFLPSFIFVALTAPFIPKLRKSKKISTLLDGLNVASLSLLFGSGILIAEKYLFLSLHGLAIFGVSLLLLMKYKINSFWLILGAGLFTLLI